MQVKDLNHNPQNPRKMSSEKAAMLKNSLVEFGNLDGIIRNLTTNRLSGGHQRTKVLPPQAEIVVTTRFKKPTKTGTVALGYVLWNGERHSYREVRWSEAKEKAANIAANKGAGEWDLLQLGEWMRELDEFGFDLDLTMFDPEERLQFFAEEGAGNGSLADRFLVPPFSVLDTRQAYWANRKAAWMKKMGGSLSESKEKVLDTSGGLVQSINQGSSQFDPVLAEVMCYWFNIPGGHILDPFGGEQSKGVVAGEMGYPYSAVEIRKEQIAINQRATKKYKGVRYVHGDSCQIGKLLGGRKYDFCFTSPPYYDLEIYSKTDLSALGTYEEFMRSYEKIFSQCFDLLRDNSFLVVKVGEIRHKKTTAYRNFVGDNISMFIKLGFKYYNELVIISPCGTAQIRAAAYMNSGRKIAKLHQNVLVFYKGEVDQIKTRYPKIELPKLEADDAGE